MKYKTYKMTSANKNIYGPYSLIYVKCDDKRVEFKDLPLCQLDDEELILKFFEELKIPDDPEKVRRLEFLYKYLHIPTIKAVTHPSYEALLDCIRSDCVIPVQYYSTDYIHNDLPYLAIRKGDIEVLKWCIMNKFQISDMAFNKAIYHGNIEVLELIYKCNLIKHMECPYLMAIRLNSLNVLKWLYVKTYRCYCYQHIFDNINVTSVGNYILNATAVDNYLLNATNLTSTAVNTVAINATNLTSTAVGSYLLNDTNLSNTAVNYTLNITDLARNAVDNYRNKFDLGEECLNYSFYDGFKWALSEGLNRKTTKEYLEIWREKMQNANSKFLVEECTSVIEFLESL